MAKMNKRVGAALGIGLVMSAVRAFVITTNMEKNIYENDTYYLPESPAVTAFTAFTLLFMLLFAITALNTGRGKRFTHDLKSNSVVSTSCVLAFVLVGAAFMYVRSLSENELPNSMELIVAVLSVASAGVFIGLCIRPNAKRSKSTLMVLGILPLLLSVFRLLNEFISSNAAPLASSGGYHIVGLVAVMLYFLFEGKSYESGTGIVPYLFFGYISIYFMLVYSVPNLVLHCFGVFEFDYKACYSAVELVLAAYIAARMASANLYKPKSL